MMKFFLRKEVILSVFIFISIFSFGNFIAEAQESGGSVTQLYGAAWSDNAGWISLNSCEVEQDGSLTCGNVPYNVQVGGITGEITGAAWSPNIGWIKFGGLSGFPSEAGTVGDNAKIDLTIGSVSYGAVTGWARACAGTINGDCSTMESRTDGWDGWISLSGNLYSSPDLSGNGGVTFDDVNDRLVGAAWGSDVLGWIDFFDVRYGPIPPDPVPIEYNLTNSTQTSLLQIGQGTNGSASVTRTWISGDTTEIDLSAPSNLNGGNIGINITTNDPCSIGDEYPECSSTIVITVGPNVPLGPYSFDVSGSPESSGTGTDVTTVNFTVVEGPPDPPQISCSAEGPMWIYQPITWRGTIVGGDEVTPIWYWRGSEEMSQCAGSQECIVSYTTVGTKTAEVSVNGEVGPFTDCTPINIGARVFFEEI